MRLHSIFISSQPDSGLSLLVQENIKSFKRQHGEAAHTLYNGDALRAEIAQGFDAEVLRAFDALRPYSYKADLGRYCLLYLHGGVYADLSFYFHKPWQPEPTKLAVFRDFRSGTHHDTCTGVIAAPTGHKALAQAITRVCRNVRKRFYGKTALYPTGPTLFGQSIAKTCCAGDVLFGQSRWFPYGNDHDLRHMMLYDGKIITSKRKDGGAPLVSIGLSGTNDYNELWAARAVYG